MQDRDSFDLKATSQKFISCATGYVRAAQNSFAIIILCEIQYLITIRFDELGFDSRFELTSLQELTRFRGMTMATTFDVFAL